jgi:hypothetical protein
VSVGYRIENYAPRSFWLMERTDMLKEKIGFSLDER